MNNSTQLCDSVRYNETTTPVSVCAVLTIFQIFCEFLGAFYCLLCYLGALQGDDLK